MTTFFQKIGLVAKTEVSKVEGVVGIVSAATKDSLKSLIPTKDYTVTVTTGFNGEKFYARTLDGTMYKEFDSYEDMVAFVSPPAAVEHVQEPVVAPVVHTQLEDQEAAAQAEIDAAVAKLAALKAGE